MRQASSVNDERMHLEDEQILALVQTKARRFRRQIRFRDSRELIASAVVAVLTAPAVVRGPIIARLGALVILAGLALVAYRFWRARRFSASAVDVTLPVAAALRAELEQVNAQIDLRETVGWWYVAPLVGGSFILVAGTRGRAGWTFTAAYAAVAALVSWGIIALNREAVRRTLRPKREEIVRLLAHIAA
jgi:hypothetical protein